MRTEGFSTQVACRVLEVSQSGFYDWKSPLPSARSICHAWLTDLICQVDQGSRGIYGARRVHAKLTLGHGITVGHNAVAMLMPRSQGRWSQRKPSAQTAPPSGGHPLWIWSTATMARSKPDQLWVTDIERHEAFSDRAVVKGHCLVLVAASHFEAEGSLIPGTGVRVDSSPDNDGTD